MKKIYLYGNGSFLNKGCEAITRGTIRIIKKAMPDSEFVSISDEPEYDKKMNIQEIKEYYPLLKGYSVLKKITNRLVKKNKVLIRTKLKNVNKTIYNSDICISLGGDNYCYKKNYYLMKQNEQIHSKFNKKTVLWGCSISFENIDDDLVQDMKKYNLITVRESLTAENLKRKGIKQNVKIVADPAFVMDKKEVDLPKEWEFNNTIGLNISPMILNNSNNKNETYNIFLDFIKYLIKETNYKIALIPHVFFPSNNDYKLLKDIYNDINNERVILIGDQYTAEELKYIISNCNIFIGARTHATIAAYSTNIPTLVIGYSVKAKGIAKDIFGSYEKYVLPVQEIQNLEQLISAYRFIEENKVEIKNHLEKCMPEYMKRAWNAGIYIKELLKG